MTELAAQFAEFAELAGGKLPASRADAYLRAGLVRLHTAGLIRRIDDPDYERR